MIYMLEIFRNYKLRILYETNAKRKKKKENFLLLNISRNSNAKSNIINAIFNTKIKTNLIVYKLKVNI